MVRMLLAVDRMSEADLWKHLHRAVRELGHSEEYMLTHVQRRSLARRAAECAEELHKRGHQLTLPL